MNEWHEPLKNLLLGLRALYTPLPFTPFVLSIPSSAKFDFQRLGHHRSSPLQSGCVEALERAGYAYLLGECMRGAGRLRPTPADRMHSHPSTALAEKGFESMTPPDPRGIILKRRPTCLTWLLGTTKCQAGAVLGLAWAISGIPVKSLSFFQFQTRSGLFQTVAWDAE